MAMDISALTSINSLLGATYGASTTSNQATSGTSFENYLMSALSGTGSTEGTSSVSSLLDMISGSGNTSLVNGLTSTGTSNDFSSQLLQSLQSTSSTDASANSLLNTGSTSATDSFTSGLTSNFQATIMQNMNAAKAKLQNSYTDYVTRAGDNPSEAAKLRMDQMAQNIALVDGYLTDKTAESSTSTQMNDLLSQLTNASGVQSSGTTSTQMNDLLSQLTSASGAQSSNTTTSTTNQSLLDQLNSNSSLTQYLMSL